MSTSTFDPTLEISSINFMSPDYPMGDFLHIPSLRGSGSDGGNIDRGGGGMGSGGGSEREYDGWSYFFSLFLLLGTMWFTFAPKVELSVVMQYGM